MELIHSFADYLAVYKMRASGNRLRDSNLVVEAIAEGRLAGEKVLD